MGSTLRQLFMEEDGFFLPHDIIFNVLKRLPVKSLLRFRCVCKNWNDLFKTSLFIKEHLHHSSHHRGPSLFLQWNYFTFKMLDSDKKTLMPLNPPFVNHPLHHIRVIGSSYGLVCFQLEFDGSLFLWNPATKEVQYVPNTKGNDLCRIGFGFSRVVNDYKIVRIRNYIKSVEVYSLSTGLWKEVAFGNLLEGVIVTPGVSRRFAATDEAIYWLAYNRPINILSFNTETEVLTLIPRPVWDIQWNMKLIAYENKLAFVSGFELWLMEKATSGGTGQIWNKTKFIGSDPMTIWRNEAVFEFDPIPQTPPKLRVGLYLVNLATNKLKGFLIDSEYCNIRSAFNYVESLVSIGNKS